MRRDAIGLAVGRHARQGRQREQLQLAGRPHHRPCAHRIAAANPHGAADVGIEQRRGLDARAASPGQVGDAGGAALVAMARLLEQAVDHGAQRRREYGLFQPRIRIDPGLAHPRARQVEAAQARVLAHVAGDVGELHGDAELAGPRQRRARLHAHHAGHHRAHRTGHASGVGAHLGKVLVVAAIRIPFETLEQRAGPGAGYAIARHHRREGAIGGLLARCAGVDAVEAFVQVGQGAGVRAGSREGGAVPRTGAVDAVVGQAAEGVQGTGGTRHLAREDSGSGQETARAVDQQALAGDQVLIGRQSVIRRGGGYGHREPPGRGPARRTVRQAPRVRDGCRRRPGTGRQCPRCDCADGTMRSA